VEEEQDWMNFRNEIILGCFSIKTPL